MMMMPLLLQIMVMIVMVMMMMVTQISRHANLVLHVRMKGALLGSVDLALQVVIIIIIIPIILIIIMIHILIIIIIIPILTTIILIIIIIVMKQKARGSALFPFPTSAFKMLPGIELSNGVNNIIIHYTDHIHQCSPIFITIIITNVHQYF